MTTPVAPAGNLFVKVSRRFNEEITTESGITLFQDTTFHPEWHTCIEGTVASVPMRVGNELGNRGIAPFVQPGDTVFFEYHILLDRRNSLLLDGETYWLVPYGCLFGRVTADGAIEVTPGKALVEPEQEAEVPERQGLIYIPESARVKKERKDRGILRHAGIPLRGQEPLGDIIGRRVFFPEFCAHRNTILGSEYYVMQQEYILAYE